MARQTVSEVLDEIAHDICENYCKYTAEIDKDESLMAKYCDSCPLVKKL